MDRNLDNGIQQKARDLARQITVAHDLDPEIQEELYGHIEDKLLAYKSGEERITDEDAFILVREHFGDAKVLRALMREVHARAVRTGWVRTMLALVFTILAARILARTASTLLSVVLWVAFPPEKRVELLGLFTMPIPWLQVAGVFLVLVWWRRDGATPWFQHWPLWRMFLGCTVLGGIIWMLPTVAFSNWAASEQASLSRLMITDRWVIPFLFCATWLWWSGAFTKPWKYGLAVCALWALFQLALSLSPIRASILVGDPGPEYGMVLGRSWNIVDDLLTGYVKNAWRGMGVERIAMVLGREFLRAMCCLAVMCGVFQLMARGRAESTAVDMDIVH